ncbi:MAG: hypothetical protein NZ901_07945 [Geminocystis sp.]|nr:hypothetical protein [Geminocystis sp.]HIK37975.1 hypothetical protein [Geminocystis sp. M7585_C2015_104]MCS7148104.1 hypothetical protein [Geminocystis sp.]MCX8077849.1 hypothetical protein [Geminocystis sp.]MDW8116456.1 hypothetical protein [Geminocystis sp.]
MSYCFDIVGISPILDFFYYQQQVEQNPHRSRAYLGSYECTLDSFIQSTEMIIQKPDWDWDEVIESIVQFWLQRQEEVEHWRRAFSQCKEGNLLVGRIANMDFLRKELVSLL